jgi:hypothetical protein
MMSHRILPENTIITIWSKMKVKIEYLDASSPQRKTGALSEN